MKNSLGLDAGELTDLVGWWTRGAGGWAVPPRGRQSELLAALPRSAGAVPQTDDTYDLSFQERVFGARRLPDRCHAPRPCRRPISVTFRRISGCSSNDACATVAHPSSPAAVRTEHVDINTALRDWHAGTAGTGRGAFVTTAATEFVVGWRRPEAE
jgi:hypothetical protein